MIFLAQAESFSMLRQCITKLHTFQHDNPGYLGALQETSGLDDTSCSFKSYFRDSEIDIIRKKMSGFRLTSVEAI